MTTTTTTHTVETSSMVRLICDSAAAWGARAAINVNQAIHTIHRDNIGYDDFETAAYECAVMAAHVARPVAELMDREVLELQPVDTFAHWATTCGALSFTYRGRNDGGRAHYEFIATNGARVYMRIVPNAHGGAWAHFAHLGGTAHGSHLMTVLNAAFDAESDD